jgi:hypothetical protein
MHGMPSTATPDSSMPLIGSPHCLNSEFAFYTHSEHYLNITTHFRILFCIFGAHSTSLQLIRTSEAHFGNFGPISDLRSLFQKLRIYFGPPKIISETSHLQNLYSHLQISSDHSSGPYTSPPTSFHHVIASCLPHVSLSPFSTLFVDHIYICTSYLFATGLHSSNPHPFCLSLRSLALDLVLILV